MNEKGAMLDEAVGVIRSRVPEPPDVAIVLGSGLGALAAEVADAVEIPFQDIPGFPPAGVSGHSGRIFWGRLEGRRVLLQAGRFHYYEGHPEPVVTLPIRCARRLGARALLLTNAAGGIRRDLRPGTVVLLDDLLGLQWRSPLLGTVMEGEARFPDMSAPFAPELGALAASVAEEAGISLPRGVYAGVLGPGYETPAEVRMLAALGADLVGMSTVPEVIAARAGGLPVLGLSLITNRAAGLAPAPLSHREVLETGASASAFLVRLLRGVVARLPAMDTPGPPPE